MDWFDYFLLGIIVLFVMHMIIMSIYCRVCEKLESRRISRRAKLTPPSFDIESGKMPNSIQSKTKTAVIAIYRFIDPYLYGLMRYSLIMIGRFPSHRIRKLFYRYVFCMKITRKTVIYGGCEIRSPWNIRIGNAVIAVGCLLDGREGITIGDHVVFGSGVRLWTEEHSVNDPWFRVLEENAQPIIVEDRAWICSDSTLLPGVRIGQGAVVAARACVTRDCEEYSIYGGVPAKKIGIRNRELTYELNGKPTWHFY